MSCEHLTMSYSTFSKTKNDALKEPMFFGQPVNVARYDQQKYEVFEKLIEKQLSFFWRPEEIDVSRDRIDYANLPEHEKHIFHQQSEIPNPTRFDPRPQPECCVLAFGVYSRAGNVD